MSGKEVQEPRLTLRVKKDLHRWFKWYALKHETTMSAIIKDYLEELRRKDESAKNPWEAESR